MIDYQGIGTFLPPLLNEIIPEAFTSNIRNSINTK